MATIDFREITEDNWLTCVHLSVRSDQTEFVASNAFSLAQATYQSHPHLIPLGVYESERMVGFVMYAHPSAPPDSQGRHWIIRIMISQEYQGKGYGRATTQALLAHMKATIPNLRQIALDYHERNHVAAHLYTSLGFVPTGEREETEIIAVLSVSEEG